MEWATAAQAGIIIGRQDSICMRKMSEPEKPLEGGLVNSSFPHQFSFFKKCPSNQIGCKHDIHKNH
jgi:hypothetical protein